MKTKTRYLWLGILGVILPYSQFIPFLQQHGLDMRYFVEEVFANRISTFFAADVLVSAIVLWVFVAVEGRRRGMKHLWAPLVASLTVGVSLGLPLFLYMREVSLEKQPPGST